MNECRLGQRIPKNGSTKKEVIVEVGIEIGLMTTAEVNYSDGKIDEENLKLQLGDKIKDIFDIDGRDKVLNNVCIYSIQ